MSRQVKRWLWGAVVAAAALQVYFVRELLAALILFGILFGVLLIVGLLLFLVQLGGTRAMAAAGSALKAVARKSPAPSLRTQ